MRTFVTDGKLVASDSDPIPGEREGIDWIDGMHDEASLDGAALLAARALAGDNTLQVGWRQIETHLFQSEISRAP